MLSQQDIVKALHSMGLTTGDKVLLHSSLASIGKVDGGAEAVVNAFLEVLGDAGTLLVPVFGKLGIVTELVKQHPDAVISDCPKGTLAAIGADAEAFCKDHWKAETVHGDDTPYTRLADAGGYVCLLGVDQDRNTSLHSVEALLRLPYLNEETAEDFETAEGIQSKTWSHYPGPHRDFIGLDRELRDSGNMTTGLIGNAVTRLIRAADLFKVGLTLGKEDPSFCLCDNPNCDDCLTQRAAIRKSQLAKENFTFAVSASLAGYYVEQIIDEIQQSGVDKLELDQLRGKPIVSHKKDVVVKACRDFEEAGIEVIALRSATVPADYEAFLDMATACKAQRVVIPLNGNSKEQLSMAQKAGVQLSFVNIIDSGAGASCSMSQIPDAGFTFNPFNFAIAGEKPFLQVFHKGRFRKYIDQLDVCDGLFSDSRSKLACGNAEIKELVSILRCSSFDGIMCLAGSNAYVYDDCQDAVAAFCELLEEI